MPSQLSRVVRVFHLRAFEAEVQPGSIVRLLYKRQVEEVSARLSVALQGVNAQGEIIWLHHEQTVSWLKGPCGLAASAISAAMTVEHELVLDYLEKKGYGVRTGSDYALPRSLVPLAGRFECVRWINERQDAWRVEAADVQPVAAMTTETCPV